MSNYVKGRKSVSAVITGQDAFTDPLFLHSGEQASVSVAGVASSKVALQRCLDGTNWRDVKVYEAPAEETYVADERGHIRLGVKTGDYGGGDTIAVRLGKG